MKNKLQFDVKFSFYKCSTSTGSRVYEDCNPTIYPPFTPTDRGHCELTEPLANVILLSVQQKTLRTVTR